MLRLGTFGPTLVDSGFGSPWRDHCYVAEVGQMMAMMVSKPYKSHTLLISRVPFKARRHEPRR